MNPDLYGAWLTAGDRLQPVVGWLAANWWWLAAALAMAFAAWAIQRSLRDAGQRIDAALADLDHHTTETRREDR